jgi:Holliday junction resolvase
MDGTAEIQRTNLMGKYQRNKGVRGERVVGHLLSSEGWRAKRGQQHAAIDPANPSNPNPDVVVADASWPFHVEVKFVEALNVGAVYKRAVEDSQASGKRPVVFHKKSRQPLLVTLSAEDFLKFLKPQPEKRTENGDQIYAT